ncbi:MAG: hypothetical protein WBW80_04550 [Acidimicrobiales bacterium]
MIRDRLARGRDGLWKRLLKVGFIRRWYARRLLKFIQKSKDKHRPLPDHLVQVDAITRRLPKPQRAKKLEEMLVPQDEEDMGREFRRAAERQNRSKGHGGPGKRPGMPPQQVVRRQPKGRR